MLGELISSSACTKRHGAAKAGGRTVICSDLYWLVPSPSEAHLLKSRRAQRDKSRWEPKPQAPVITEPSIFSGCFPGLPPQSLSPMSTCDTQQPESIATTLQIPWQAQGVAAWECNTLWGAGEEDRNYCDMFRGGTKGGKMEGFR